MKNTLINPGSSIWIFILKTILTLTITIWISVVPLQGKEPGKGFDQTELTELPATGHFLQQ